MGGTNSKDDQKKNESNTNKSTSSSEMFGSDSLPNYSTTLKESGANHLSIDSLTTICSLPPDAMIMPQTLINLGYELHQEIGSGAFSTVYVASNRRLPGIKLACKMFNLYKLKQEWTEKYLKCEMKIMTKRRHKNIVAAYDVFKTRSKAFIFMKWAQNGNLDKYIARNFAEGRVGEDQTRKWYFGMMSAVCFLHQHNVAHRDLKLENFLLDEHLEPLLTDFGFSIVNEQVTKWDAQIMGKTICGTVLYTAPEVHSASKSKPYDAKKADIYSMGVCLYEMLHGFRPFEGDYCFKSIELIKRQKTCDYKIIKSFGISANCQNLIRSMLEPVPEYRVSARAVLAHPWLQSLSHAKFKQ